MRRNVAGQFVGAQMISATDGSAFTGSVTVSVTGDAGTQATGSVGAGACTHEGNGFHTYAPAQAETNYTHVAFTFTGTGAIPVTVQIYPTSYDASGRVDVGSFGGVAGTFSGGRPEVNTTHAAGTAWGSGAITAASIAADAITAAKVAADVTTEIQSGLATAAALSTVDSNVTAIKAKTDSLTFTVAGKVDANATHAAGTAWGSGAITAASIATGALTASKFAAGAIDAAALATDAAQEIRDAIVTATLTELTVDPGASPELGKAILLGYMAIRNKRETDSSLGTDKIYNSAGSAILSATITDTGTVFTKAKYA